jgi:excisionase family DNA binding protein
MSKPLSPYKTFSIKEAAEYCGTDRRIIQAALDAGKLRATRTLVAVTRVRVSDLADWLITLAPEAEDGAR